MRAVDVGIDFVMYFSSLVVGLTPYLNLDKGVLFE